MFTGGDCYTGPQFAIRAIAAGKQGAISIHRFVQPGQSLVNGRDRREYHAFDKENVVLEGYDTAARQQAGHNTTAGRYQDTRVTFTEEQMKMETQRCLGCGTVQVDAYMCIGCGLCTTRCKFDAIKLERRSDITPGVYEELPLKFAKNAVKRMGKIVKTAVKEHL